MVCDVSNVGIRVVLIQEGHLISFFSEKLKGAQINYSTYDKELHSLVRSYKFGHTTYYPMSSSSIATTSHSITCGANIRKANIMANTLSRRHVLLAMLETKLLGFESLKDMYMGDDDFKKAYELCANSANGGFYKHEGFLFREKKLCVPRSSIRELSVKEAHEGALISHFREQKTYETLHEHFLLASHEEGCTSRM
ncbi:hypothetical protein CR513_13650, partial [Mucuna pruriens]